MARRARTVRLSDPANADLAQTAPCRTCAAPIAWGWFADGLTLRAIDPEPAEFVDLLTARYCAHACGAAS